MRRQSLGITLASILSLATLVAIILPDPLRAGTLANFLSACIAGILL